MELLIRTGHFLVRKAPRQAKQAKCENHAILSVIDTPFTSLSQAVPAECNDLPHLCDFLALWKDADPDIPMLKQAKAEYAKLQ